MNPLAKYADGYFASEFVPFPNPQEAAEAITETMSHVGNWEEEIKFVDEVIHLLREWKEQRIR